MEEFFRELIYWGVLWGSTKGLFREEVLYSGMLLDVLYSGMVLDVLYTSMHLDMVYTGMLLSYSGPVKQFKDCPVRRTIGICHELHRMPRNETHCQVNTL